MTEYKQLPTQQRELITRARTAAQALGVFTNAIALTGYAERNGWLARPINDSTATELATAFAKHLRG